MVEYDNFVAQTSPASRNMMVCKGETKAFKVNLINTLTFFEIFGSFSDAVTRASEFAIHIP